MTQDSQTLARTTMDARGARKALDSARRSVMHSAYWTAELVDRKGWKALGFDTAEAFADEELGLTRSTLWRVLIQGRIIRQLSGGDLENLGSYVISQRTAEMLKRASDETINEAGTRIAGGEKPNEVVAELLALLNPQPELEDASRDARRVTTDDQPEHEEDGAETDAGTREDPDPPQPEDGALDEAPAGNSDSEDPSPPPSPPPAPPSPPDPPGDGSTEDEERAKNEAAKAEDKAVGDLVRSLLPLEPAVLSRAAKRSDLAKLEGLAKRAQQAAPDHDGSRVVLLAADLVSRFPALPSEPFDAGVNRAIRDLLAEVERLRQPTPAQPAPAPPPATKAKPAAATKKAPKPTTVKRPKKGEPCPHPREAHVGVDMRGVTCSWCDAKALTHVSLERMGQAAVAAR